MNTKNLSKPQRAALAKLRQSTRPLGVSYRLAYALADKGLVRVVDSGSRFSSWSTVAVELTEAGRSVAGKAALAPGLRKRAIEAAVSCR